jgi:hypothetical protein
VVSERQIDDLVAPVHDALFGERYTGQVWLYHAIRDGVVRAYELGVQHRDSLLPLDHLSQPSGETKPGQGEQG